MSRVFSFQVQAAIVRRDAPSSGGQLDQLQKNADEFAKTFNEQINSLVNSKNTQDLNKALKESSDAILHQVSDLSKSLQSAVSNLFVWELDLHIIKIILLKNSSSNNYINLIINDIYETYKSIHNIVSYKYICTTYPSLRLNKWGLSCWYQHYIRVIIVI